ncbi:MAG: hypothetical protein V1492_04550 [Candidatus Micrarchaeota archaeon]
MELRYAEAKKNTDLPRGTTTSRRNILRRIADRFKDIDVKKTAKNAAVAAMFSTVLLVGAVKCGPDQIENPPIEQVDAGRDAGSKDACDRDAKGGEDATVKPDTGQDGGADAEVPDVGPKDGGAEAGPDMDEKDVGGDDPCADAGKEDGGQDIGPGDAGKDAGPDAGSTTCTTTVTDLQGAKIDVNYEYYKDGQPVECNKVQGTEVDQVKISFENGLEDDGDRMLAKRGISIDVEGRTLEFQKVESATEVVFIIPRVDWTMPVCDSLDMRLFDASTFSCTRIVDDETVKFNMFAGPVSSNNPVKKGSYRCRDPPADGDYKCGKLYTVNPAAKDGKILTGITAENRGWSFELGKPVKTKAMFTWQQNENNGVPVSMNGKQWNVTAIDVTDNSGTNTATPKYVINSMEIMWVPGQ